MGANREALKGSCTSRPVLFPAAFTLFSLFFILVFSGTALAASTKIISTTDTGGDCASIGVWDAAAKTCTLNTDVTANAGSNGIEIINDSITLDGAGHAVYGNGGSSTGGSLSVRNGVTIKNLRISGFNFGIYLLASGSNKMFDNTVSGNVYGLYLVSSSNNKIYNNNFVGNTTQVTVSGGSGNAFDTLTAGGNYWSTFDTPEEGCEDNNGNFICDAPLVFTGGADNSPWTNADAWKVTPPADTTPPVIGSVEPAGTIGTGSTIVRITYSDAAGSINTTSVAVFLDGVALGGCTANQTNVSCPVTGLATGGHAISGSVADNHGNVAPFSGSFTFTDTTAPVVSNVLPAGTLATGTATISADFTDGDGSGINTATASVYLDGAAVSGCSAGATGVTCAVTGLGQGNHSLTVSVADSSGNPGSGSGSFMIDSVAPAVSGVSPAGTINTSSTNIVVDYSDSGSGVAAASVAVTLDGNPLGGCSVSATSASCSVTGLALGAHTIGGSVADSAGNSGPISGSFSFADTAAPSITSILPTGTVNTSTVALSASYSDGAGSGIDSASVTVYLDAAPVSGCSAGASSVSCSVEGLANGSHTILVSLRDIAGNPGSGSQSFTVDTTAPEITPSKYLRDDAAGGDCASIGSWNAATKTCTLTRDLTFNRNGIEILSNGITLDGAGHTITGADANTTGGSLSVKSNITIKNLTIRNFGYGIYLMVSNNNTLTGNTLTGNKTGILLSGSSNNRIYRNNFVGNTTQASMSGGSGNVFNLASPEGGNYWDDFDTVAEGCTDAGGDGFCDAARTFTGGQDNLPRTSGFELAPPAVKPNLNIRVTWAFWGSYADYLARNLSVNLAIANTGSTIARNVRLTGSSDSAGVSLTTTLPVNLGDITAGSSAAFTLSYYVPAGVTRWFSSYAASAQDSGGNNFTYP